MKRLLKLWIYLDFIEFVKVIYYHVIFKSLNRKNIFLFHKLVVLLHQIDNNLKICRKKNEYFLQAIENKTQYDILLRNNTSDFFIFLQVFVRKDYKSFLDIIDKQESKNLNIVDAGANIGLATLYFRSYFPHSNIICIEPESSNFTILSHNIKQNFGAEQTILLQAALWYENTKLSIDNGFRDKSHCAFTVSNTFDKTQDTNLVNAYSISYLMNKYNIPIIDILKIDIEGAEKEIMTNDSELSICLPFCKFIAIEVHEEIIKEEQVINILERYNFSIGHSGEYLIAQQQPFNYDKKN